MTDINGDILPIAVDVEVILPKVEAYLAEAYGKGDELDTSTIVDICIRIVSDDLGTIAKDVVDKLVEKGKIQKVEGYRWLRIM